jgi:hypothetical protein
MRYIHQLQIHFDPSIETYNAITKILFKMPKKETNVQTIPNAWTYEVISENEDPYFDYINEFLHILEDNYEKLHKIGIEKDSISIWLFYEYDSQCNMEFDPKRLKRLGDNGITLCISCWDTGE